MVRERKLVYKKNWLQLQLIEKKKLVTFALFICIDYILIYMWKFVYIGWMFSSRLYISNMSTNTHNIKKTFSVEIWWHIDL